MQIFDAQNYNESQANGTAGYDRQWIKFSNEAVDIGNGKFENSPHIRIRVDRQNEIFRKVEDHDKINYKSRYDAFIAGEEVPEEGTPVKAWSAVSVADQAACKQAKIYTVEQLAAASDDDLQRGGIVALKYKAIDWLALNQDSGVLADLRDQLDKAKEKIKLLEERNKILKVQNDAIKLSESSP